MRTTLEIDDDVLQAANELSVREKTTAGRLILEWARRGIRARADKSPEPAVLNGFEVLPAEGRVVTNESVRQLVEETEDA
jgi:hypothetical protein